MKQNSSSRKLNEQAREVIASIVLFDLSDPRLDMITITGCEVSFDRSACNVFYSAPNGAYQEAAAALESAKGRIRSLMGKRLSWRVTPQLRFILDTTIDSAERISAALAADAPRMAQHAEDADAAGADRSLGQQGKDDANSDDAGEA